MSHDDILDGMSLSDDEMLDSLADDMLLEMETEKRSAEEEIPTIQPTRSSSTNRHPHAMPMMPAGFPFAPNGAAAGGMPDLGQMMSQMMPMMSQMFGGGGGAGMGGMNPNAIKAPALAWDELVRQHVPADEQATWLETIRADEATLRQDVAAKRYGRPPSRSYHGNAKPLPNVYMETETLLASLLNEAVRARNAEHNPKWKQYHENLVSHLTKSGLANVFAKDLKDQLRRRVTTDPDYAAARAADPTRFANIAKALEV